MFAEFEKQIHASIEANEPLTVDRFKEVYRGLLEQYFGPDFTLDDELTWSACASRTSTGRSTSTSTPPACRPRSPWPIGSPSGGPAELNDYLGFLKGGCSKDPLDLLRGAGVDMEKPAAVDNALARFDRDVKELDSLI